MPNNVVVAKLQTFIEKINIDSERNASKRPIHSIAVVKNTSDTKSPLSAHMETMCLLHDHQMTCLDPGVVCDVIKPALAIEKVNKDLMRQERIRNNDPDHHVQNLANMKGSVNRKIPVDNARKSTSAASFFNPMPNSISGQETTYRSASKQEIKNEVISSNLKRGNADDFVGDIDEDEDFLKEDAKRIKRSQICKAERKNPEAELKKKKNNRNIGTDEDRPEDTSKKLDDEATRCTRESFVSKGTSDDVERPNQPTKIRRKQVLEEKTFVDDTGFLRTETVSVWKTIDTDEEDKDSSRVPSLSKGKAEDSEKIKVKNMKTMKQQGLMGYFSKKK